ncbi:hypothetical protein GCM10009530_20470 [Microbispora corallina]|uniref:Uncharacterized protein n=1 Tax=Microbispora corallina TaxID=83302 RepID=A0ABQ4FU01_9ACTN|nr:hypothetical protein Mco01_12930 [Microbispora corallina]
MAGWLTVQVTVCSGWALASAVTCCMNRKIGELRPEGRILGHAIENRYALSHQGDVLGPAVIVIAGHVAGVPFPDPSGLVGEGVPDGRAPAVLRHGPLDLV